MAALGGAHMSGSVHGGVHQPCTHGLAQALACSQHKPLHTHSLAGMLLAWGFAHSLPST